MVIKSLFAAAAIASAVAFGSAGTADANPYVTLGIGFDGGGPGYGGWDGGSGYGGWDGGSGYYDGGYGDEDGYSWRRRSRQRWDEPRPRPRGISCAQGRGIVASSGFRGVFANSCSAPVYRYTGWKNGEQFRIVVNFRGNIVAVNPIY